MPVVDCVLVVPSFFAPAERRALLDAARLAGLNVLSLVHSYAAAALQYGIERDFTNRTENVIFYDMGAGSTEAALVKFSTFTNKKVRPRGVLGRGKKGCELVAGTRQPPLEWLAGWLAGGV